MTSIQREQIRLSILRYLNESSPYGVAATLLLQYIRAEGFRELSQTQLQSEIMYLSDKFFVEPMEKKISPENQTWRIKAEGRDFLAQQ